MSQFKVDFEKLETQLLKKSYRLADVKDQLETVAFDIVRFKNTDKSTALWQVQSAEDGDYIISLYEDAEDNKKTASQGWEVVLSSGSSLVSSFAKTAAKIRPSGEEWEVVSDAGKSLGKYKTKEEAEKRLRAAEYFKEHKSASASFEKFAFVRKLPNGKWRVESKKGKNLGTFDTKEEADKHLGQVEFFKHQGKAASNKILNFFYKGQPITRVSADTIGIPESELASVERNLPKRLASNKKLVAALLSTLPKNAKKEVLDKYPELL